MCAKDRDRRNKNLFVSVLIIQASFILDGWNKALSWDEFREILELSF